MVIEEVLGPAPTWDLLEAVAAMPLGPIKDMGPALG